MQRIPRAALALASLLAVAGCGPDSASGSGGIIDACPEIPNPEPFIAEGCTITSGDRPSCLVLRHAVIECETFWTFPGGVRVAVDEERGAMLVANDGYVPRLVFAGADGYGLEVLPSEFVRALTLVSQDDEGTLGFALSENEAEPTPGYEGRKGLAIHLATRSGDGWTFEELPTTGTLELLGFELDAAGTPNVWYTPDTSWAPQRLTQGVADEWIVEPITSEGKPRFSLGADEVALTYGYRAVGSDSWQLGVQTSDGEVSLGPIVEQQGSYVALPPARPSSANAGPDALALGMSGDDPERQALHLLGSDGLDVVIPNTTPLVETCTIPLGSCPKSCHETGAGVVEGSFAGARASDGSVWLGWVHRQLDHRQLYYEECDEPDDPSACACVQYDSADQRDSDTLHIARVIDGQVEERLTFDIPRIASGNIDMRAYGDRLAVGLQVSTEVRQLHLLEIDIGGS